jgi:hypothetical protein
MSDLLMNPAVQAGVLPFLGALLLAALLARTRFLAIATASGALLLLYLTVGFAFEPLTAQRKLTILLIGAMLLAIVLEAGGVGPRRRVIAALALAASIGAVWTLQRILEQRELGAGLLAALAAMSYVGLVVGATLLAGKQPLRAAVAGASLGWGNGALAVLGASALLGQLGVALGTACAAVALVQMLRGQQAPAGWTLALPAAVGASLVGVLACATGELRWPLLLPLLLVAPVTLLVPTGLRRPWQQAILLGLATLVPVVVAVAWALMSQRAGAPAG